MLKDLREALATILKSHRNMTDEQAKETVNQWTKSKRFIVDAWA